MKYDGEQRQLLRALLECAFLLRPMGWVGKSDLGLEGSIPGRDSGAFTIIFPANMLCPQGLWL